MKHYFNPMSRAVTTDWMLKELSINYEQLSIDFSVNSPELIQLRQINPMGKLPTLVDGDLVITEVAAICAYLADKYPEKNLAPKVNSKKRGIYYRYLFVAGNTIEPAFSLASFNIEHPNPQTAGWGDMSRVMLTIESLVPETDWTLGQQFTAADVVFGGLLDSLVMFGSLAASPKVLAYINRLRLRPAYKEAHQAFTDLVKQV